MDHLTAVRDELNAASTKEDAEIKTRVQAAIQHAQIALNEMKAKQPEAARHVDELIDDGKKAMNETGTQLQARVDKMKADFKHAMDAREPVQ